MSCLGVCGTRDCVTDGRSLFGKRSCGADHLQLGIIGFDLTVCREASFNGLVGFVWLGRPLRISKAELGAGRSFDAPHKWFDFFGGETSSNFAWRHPFPVHVFPL